MSGHRRRRYVLSTSESFTQRNINKTLSRFISSPRVHPNIRSHNRRRATKTLIAGRLVHRFNEALWGGAVVVENVGNSPHYLYALGEGERILFVKTIGADFHGGAVSEAVRVPAVAFETSA